MIAWYDSRISTGKMVCVNNKIKVVKRNEYGFRDERCFNLRHYMHGMTVVSLEMSDEPYLRGKFFFSCLKRNSIFLLFAAQYGRYALFSPYLAIALYNPLVCCYFFKGHWASCMQFLCGDANLGAKSELCSISE